MLDSGVVILRGSIGKIRRVWMLATMLRIKEKKKDKANEEKRVKRKIKLIWKDKANMETEQKKDEANKDKRSQSPKR